MSNGSASHHELRKLDYRLGMIRRFSQMYGGIYMYSNLTGGDGGRLYFDGASTVSMNGKFIVH